MQGVLVFASAAARDAAITSPQEGQCCYLKDTDAVLTYSGAAWVGFDDSNAIQNSIVDAKGDLVAASGADTPARLAVGNNGETLVADSSTSTGLRYTENYAAGKNKIINGDFKIWQRGSTFNSIATNAYSADRFAFNKDGNGTFNVTRETFTPGTAPVAGYEGQYYWRATTATIGTSTFADCTQYIEDVRTFAGQTVTVSFWAKTNAARSVGVYAGADWNSANGVDYVVTSVTTSTSWTRYSATLNVTSATGKTIGANSNVQIILRCPMVAGSTFELWGVQVESGSVATAFQTATGTIQGELAACQRYYFRQTNPNSALVFNFGTGQNISTTAGLALVKYPVSMRTRPTALEQSGTAAQYGVTNASASVVSCSAVPAYDTLTTAEAGAVLYTVASGLVAGNASFIFSSASTGSYLGWSAEL
jgi:hypothetical protein